MRFLKRLVCIITVISLLASVLCLSAFAVQDDGIHTGAEFTFYKDNIMGKDIGLYGANGNWSFRQNDAEGTSPAMGTYVTSSLRWSPFQWDSVQDLDDMFGMGFISPAMRLLLDDYLDTYQLNSLQDVAARFTIGDGLFDNQIFSAMAHSTTVHHDTVKLQVFEGVGGLFDFKTTWYDDTPVTYSSLLACCAFLQNQGFLCQVVRLPYVVVYPNGFKYGQCHVLAFYGELSGGYSFDVSNTKVVGDWYLLCDFDGSYFASVYGAYAEGDPEIYETLDPSSPDSSLETDGRDYIDLDVPLTYWDQDNLLYYDFTNNTYIPIGAYMYNPSLYKYQFYNVDNSTTINITYNIDYTQVTYIGSSDEYDAYEFYYKLPDGRSSADMTAEDLEQLNLNYDVINYGKSTDDGRLRSLYHLDGNTDDSSYWVNQTSFEWVTNPSIEYLEATNFEGCLYLDEQDHVFKLKLPSRLSASDFTIQFRYYHYGYGDTENNTATNYTDLVVQAVDTATQNATLFTNLAGTLTTDSTTPIGQWSEVCIVRDGTTLYTYVNGVVIDSKPFADVLGDTLLFDFKDVSVRRQIDEIRVFNYARYVGGVSYTPITVPMDTNLVLVLPDEGIPLPDGYWDFNTDGNLLTYQDFTLGEEYPILNIGTYSNQYFGFTRSGLRLNDPVVFAAALGTGKTGLSYSVYSDYWHLGTYSHEEDSYYKFPLPNNNRYIQYSSPYGQYTGSGYVVPLASANNLGSSVTGLNLTSGHEYSFTLVFKDGTQSSHTFIYGGGTSDPNQMGVVYSYTDFDWGRILYQRCVGDYNYGGHFISIQPLNGIDLVYMELKEGEPNDQSGAYKTVVYNESDIKPNTIAVRSTIPVRTWRIGGVRPTLPYRGDVWIMIQNKRITSTQIYTGTMWTEVDVRIWTGERWAWPNYFDILTQQDMTDINGTTDNVYIQDDTGYYSWITEQWKQLLDLLNSILDGISNIDGGTDINLDFNFDGTVSIEFADSVEVGRNSLYELLQFFYEYIFKPAVDGLGNGLDTFSVIISPSGGSITVDGQVVESPMGIIGKEFDWTV